MRHGCPRQALQAENLKLKEQAQLEDVFVWNNGGGHHQIFPRDSHQFLLATEIWQFFFFFSILSIGNFWCVTHLCCDWFV